METFVYRIIGILVGYIFGIFQTSYIYGRLNHVDIRKFGSGNAGTTNALRVLGKKAGVITYIGDALKAVLAGVVMRLVCVYAFNITDQGFIYVILFYTGLGVVLGHNYPFYMGFKGGKGIAASSGVIISLGNIWLIVLAMGTFIGVALISKYVSLASICMMTLFFFEFVLFGLFKFIPIGDYFLECVFVALTLTILAIIRHRQNIVRLINGDERKIGQNRRD